MEVKDLMEVLARCNPKAKVVIYAAFEGITEVHTVVQYEAGNLDGRYSFEMCDVVQLINAESVTNRDDVIHTEPRGSVRRFTRCSWCESGDCKVHPGP